MQSEENMSEILSSLVDGEANISQTDIDNIKNKPEMSKKWENYHLMKDVMQGTVPAAVPKDFSTRVMHAIAQEPVVLAPKARVAQKSWLRPAAGFAVAATVALATIGGLQTVWQSNDGNGGAVPLNQLAANPANISRVPVNQINTVSLTNAQPVNLRAAGVQLNHAPEQSYANNLRWKRIVPMDAKDAEAHNKKMAKQLNQMLMNHVRSAGTMQGMLPYARLAGYDEN